MQRMQFASSKPSVLNPCGFDWTEMISDGSRQCSHRAFRVATELALRDALGIVWVLFYPALVCMMQYMVSS